MKLLYGKNESPRMSTGVDQNNYIEVNRVSLLQLRIWPAISWQIRSKESSDRRRA